jgi:hypothetical protein
LRNGALSHTKITILKEDRVIEEWGIEEIIPFFFDSMTNSKTRRTVSGKTQLGGAQ